MRLTAIPLLLALLLAPAFSAGAEEKGHAHAMTAPKKAVCVLVPSAGSKAQGVLTLTQGDGVVQITGTVKNLTPGKHGFHIHEFGDLTSTDGSAAGGHFNPEGHEHAGPEAKHRHVGDLGNIDAKADGTANVTMKVEGLKLADVLGRSFVVHEKEDDLKSQPSGNAGPRIAVGVIGVASDKEAKK
jgi:Cu-Zn family superoxide dismutase